MNRIKYEKDVKDRWSLTEQGGILWDVEKDTQLPHRDHIEMSGRLASVIVSYGVEEDRSLALSWKVVWPTLRTIPNNTHASLMKEFKGKLLPDIKVNGKNLSREKTYSILFDGMLTIKSHTEHQLDIIRTVFPSTENAAAVQKVVMKNTSEDPMDLTIESIEDTVVERGVHGIYLLEVLQDAPKMVRLMSGESFTFGIFFHGRNVMDPIKQLDAEEEEAKRKAFVKRIMNSLRLETPDSILNQAFKFAKLRAAESVFKTKKGLMHGPGGGSYYAAVWTNDQVEYAGPFFPFLGEEGAIEASLNCYRLYRAFMGPDYRPIPTSIIAEGIDIWEGAGDRGDAAMYAYGASRFALEMGDRQIAEELWPAIEWCLEYCKRKMTAEGVIASDSDELEGRFPTGKANLSTSSLTYGGLRSAANLARSLGKIELGKIYDGRAEVLYNTIEDYFGFTVEGFDTYRYYDGNDVLRSWICLPLTMGIMKRKEATIAALFSPRLWTEDGLATQAGDITFWDRSTLYGFRGVFTAGETERAMQYFTAYSRRRLLGEHVPYAVEAYPEGNQRHLSAESALYCRVITEGMFGITPTGLNTFTCIPRLPENWSSMALRSIKAFGKVFDLVVERVDNKRKISVLMKGSKTQEFFWDGKQELTINLGKENSATNISI